MNLLERLQNNLKEHPDHFAWLDQKEIADELDTLQKENKLLKEKVKQNIRPGGGMKEIKIGAGILYYQTNSLDIQSIMDDMKTRHEGHALQ